MHLGKRQVLCVDDHKDTCQLLQVCFSEWDVRIAFSGTQALLIARKEIFDLYILDTWLPEVDGVELCSKIRRFDPNTPILFLSADAYPGTKDEAIGAGANDYVLKPADPQLLKERAQSLMWKADLRDLEARSLELAALSENLRHRSGELFARSSKHTARVRAYQQFTRAGGTRANFARFWADFQASH